MSSEAWWDLQRITFGEFLNRKRELTLCGEAEILLDLVGLELTNIDTSYLLIWTHHCVWMNFQEQSWHSSAPLLLTNQTRYSVCDVWSPPVSGYCSVYWIPVYSQSWGTPPFYTTRHARQHETLVCPFTLLHHEANRGALVLRRVQDHHTYLQQRDGGGGRQSFGVSPFILLLIRRPRRLPVQWRVS